MLIISAQAEKASTRGATTERDPNRVGDRLPIRFRGRVGPEGWLTFVVSVTGQKWISENTCLTTRRADLQSSRDLNLFLGFSFNRRDVQHEKASPPLEFALRATAMRTTGRQ